MRLCSLLLAVLCMAFAPAPLPKKQEAPSMEGFWMSSDLRVRVSLRLPDTGDARMTFITASYEVSYKLSLLLPAARPARFALCDSDGRHILVGIYKVEGDSLTLSYGPAKEEWPKAFSGPGQGRSNAKLTKRVESAK